MAKTLNKWLRLDNSAKIFPMLTNKKNQNLFSMTVTLRDEVDAKVLEEALNLTLPRFPSFKVRLMRGFFWYYFEENNNRALVYPTSDTVIQKISLTNCNGYCFRTQYYKNVLTFDFFHAICDGSGALEFIKSILYTYFNLLGLDINASGKVMTINSPIEAGEFQDSFLKYYKKKKLSELKIDAMKGKKAMKVNGILYDNTGKGLITLHIPVKQLKALCKEKNCTVTEYLAALYIQAIYYTQKDRNDSKNSIQLFVPINLRKIFPSITLRNFSLFSRIGAALDKPMDMDSLITLVHKCLVRDTDKQLLSDKISTTVRAEKLFVMRIMPLVIKQFIFKVSNLFFGKEKKTATFSSIGIVSLPDDMKPLIKSVSSNINVNANVPISLTALTCGDDLALAFTRGITDTMIEKYISDHFIANGINVKVISNMWEVENAL